MRTTAAVKFDQRPVLRATDRENGGIPKYYRERMSDTTLKKFCARLRKALDALEKEDEAAPVRQFVEDTPNEKRISGWVDDCFISFTISTMEGV